MNQEQIDFIISEIKVCPDCQDMTMQGLTPACCQYHLNMQYKEVSEWNKKEFNHKKLKKILKVEDHLGNMIKMSDYIECVCTNKTFFLYGGYLICSECRELLNTDYIEVKEWGDTNLF